MRLKTLVIAALGALTLNAAGAQAAEVKVLSAGAVTPGLVKALDLYRARSGYTVTVAVANGPEIARRIGAGEGGFDIVVAPEAVLAGLADSGRLRSEPVRLGRVGVAAAVRAGAPRPDLSDTEALKRSLVAARTVVISRGSTGVYLEALFERLGLTAQLAPKLKRGQTGADVVERLLTGEGAEIGLSAQTELALGEGRGLVVIGPLPETVQNYTTYSAAAFPEAMARPEVAGFMALLKSPVSAALMAASGIR